MIERWIALYFLCFTPVAFAVKPFDCNLGLHAEVETKAQLLDEYHTLQENYSSEGAQIFKEKLEAYFVSVGTVLENFNLDAFVHEKLLNLPHLKQLGERKIQELTAVMAPYFNRKSLPEFSQFKNDLPRDLQSLPLNQIYSVMEKAFGAWKTKIYFDENGPAAFNRLTKALKRKEGLGEVSLDIDLMTKNQWLAFFESEKGPGQFNPSLEGALADHFGAIEGHESTHMVLQILASRGKPSPLHIKMILDQKFFKKGAVGERQKSSLALAIQGGYDSDFYRTEFYLEELATHIVESSTASIEMSRIISRGWAEYLEKKTKDEALREESEALFAELLRNEGQDFTLPASYSRQAKRLINGFLQLRPADLGRTGLTTQVKELLVLFDSLDTLSDQTHEGLSRAQQAISNKIEQGEKIASTPELFLGKKGYLVPIRIPVDVYTRSGNWKSVEGLTVVFRFTQQAAYSPFLGPEKLKSLKEQLEWAIAFTNEIQAGLKPYFAFVKAGKSRRYTVKDLIILQGEQTLLRRKVRDLIHTIREE